MQVMQQQMQQQQQQQQQQHQPRVMQQPGVIGLPQAQMGGAHVPQQGSIPMLQATVIGPAPGSVVTAGGGGFVSTFAPIPRATVVSVRAP